MLVFSSANKPPKLGENVSYTGGLTSLSNEPANQYLPHCYILIQSPSYNVMTMVLWVTVKEQVPSFRKFVVNPVIKAHVPFFQSELVFYQLLKSPYDR